MTSKQIEALVEKLQEQFRREYNAELDINIFGEEDNRGVQFCANAMEWEYNEIMVSELTDEELENYLTTDAYRDMCRFHYFRKHWVSLWENAHIKLAYFVKNNGRIPTDVRVDIRWKDSRVAEKDVCICCDNEVYKEQGSDDFDPDLPLPNGHMDSDYHFYCNGIQEFCKLLDPDNDEDFEIIEVHGWD